jgi:NAD(P)-dependent dehydrogenase (short-subunit alcohol dehydrogenase family)
MTGGNSEIGRAIPIAFAGEDASLATGHAHPLDGGKPI